MDILRYPFNEICNFRDIGGYYKESGQWLPRGKFFRSSMLFGVDEADFNRLKDLNVQAIIDLRAPKETEKQPNPYRNLLKSYQNINLSGSQDVGRSAQLAKESDDPYFMAIRYLEYCDSYSAIKAVFDQLLSNKAKNWGTVIHCSAGKDRTGVITYLIYKAAGLPLVDIVADYQVSYAYIKHDPRIIKEGHIQNINQSYPEIMENFDRDFMAKYTSIENYFRHLGYQNQEIEALKNLLD
ncbi:tyrosine-protein phosphatase [Aerococcus sp. JJEM-2022a]|uniref:Tyrosine-protein phosphatase n=1 Tax=Aerococcus loyolae TaxID=2976809 RepID=A0ABT4C0X5_9LACT|nr:tyrosine-protein phosphatase [Aerococcus loyolae]MCY3026175.1 tyrosine-protein phosphatase [Aerococcus loyolae]